MRFPSLDSKPVVIVGGGLSGLAAAVDLTSRNIPVLLLEQKPKLGGRAYSFTDSRTGDLIDNGQHVLIAGYDRTMRFLKRIGTDDLLSVQDRPLLVMHHPVRGFCNFALPRMLQPLHLLAGILTTDLFSAADKLRMLRAGSAIKSESKHAVDDMTIDEWLTLHGQSDETRRSFWEPLAIAIMNEHCVTASANVFINAIRHAFFGRWDAAALVVPRVGLSELLVDPADRFVRARGGAIRCNADVADIVVKEDRVEAVCLKGREEIACNALILAVPHYRIAELPRLNKHNIVPSGLLSATSTPIVSIHLWFENEVMTHDVVGLIDRRVQWVFRKNAAGDSTKEWNHVSCVISGAEKFVGLSHDELVQIAIDDLRSVFGSSSLLVHAVVIREKRATFSCTPTVNRLRPDQRTTIANLFLAGDWTKTGLPATIEGAIMSGERCAEMINSGTAC